VKTDLLRKWKFARLELAAIGVMLAAGGLFYWTAVRPISSLQQRRDAQRVVLVSKQRDASASSSRVANLQSRLTTVQAAVSQCTIQLEPASNINGRIGRLTELATKQGLKVDEIRPAEVSFGHNYGWVPIRLLGSGGYRTWTEFLHQLPKTFPDVAVETFQLTGKPEEPGPVNFQVSLIWFVAPQPSLAQK
jgi:Tfp pilus assembly protein PilO